MLAVCITTFCMISSTGSTALGGSRDGMPVRSNEKEVLFSAAGLTEPRSRTVQIISEIAGKIEKIHVRAGDAVKQGDLLVEVSHDLQKAQVELGRAAVDRSMAELTRLKNGERSEEREILKAQLAEAHAMAKVADFELQRVSQIRSEAAATDREMAQYQSARDQATARERAASMRLALVEAGARPEDIQRAEAAVREARAQLAAAESQLEKTSLRSPIDGMIVYRYREPGETVITEIPTPILSVGDRSRLHIRVDVDEMDIGRVWMGQEVYAMASAFAEQRFAGRVIHIEPTLGRKNFRTDRPTEKMDTRVQEVVVELDDADEIPLELQMDVWFMNRPQRDGGAIAKAVK